MMNKVKVSLLGQTGVTRHRDARDGRCADRLARELVLLDVQTHGPDGMETAFAFRSKRRIRIRAFSCRIGGRFNGTHG